MARAVRSERGATGAEAGRFLEMADPVATPAPGEAPPSVVVPPEGPPETMACPSCQKPFQAGPKDREGNCPHCNAPLAFLSEKEYQALLEAEERKKAFQQRMAQKRQAAKAKEEEERKRLEARRQERAARGEPPVFLKLLRVSRRSRASDEAPQGPWNEPDRPARDIEGIGDVYATRLEAAGVRTVQELERSDAKALAAACDVPEATIRQWQSMAELVDVHGVGPQVAELLVRAGIHSIPALAQADPKALASQVEALQAERQVAIQGGPSGPKSVKNWIKAARKHALADQPERRPPPPEALFPPVAEPAPAEPPAPAASKGRKRKVSAPLEAEPPPAVVAEVQPVSAGEPAQPEKPAKKGFLSRFRRAPEPPAPEAATPVAENPATPPDPGPAPPAEVAAPEAARTKKGRRGKPVEVEPPPAAPPPAESVVAADVTPLAPEPQKRGFFARFRRTPSDAPAAALPAAPAEATPPPAPVVPETPAEPAQLAPDVPNEKGPRKGKKGRSTQAAPPPQPAPEATVEASIDFGSVDVSTPPSAPTPAPGRGRGWFRRGRKGPDEVAAAQPPAAVVEVGTIDFGSSEAPVLSDEKRAPEAPAKKRKR